MGQHHGQRRASPEAGLRPLRSPGYCRDGTGEVEGKVEGTPTKLTVVNFGRWNGRIWPAMTRGGGGWRCSVGEVLHLADGRWSGSGRESATWRIFPGG
jgi:hypothetical protein